MRPNEIAFGILAGGRSSRMGVDKARLRLGGKSFLEALLEAGRGFSERIVSLGEAERTLPEGVIAVRDEAVGAGPMEGIRQILRRTQKRAALVVATDMPLLTEPFLLYLAGRYGGGNLALTLDGRAEPLCSVYGRECLPAIDALFAEGIRKPAALFDRVPTTFLAVEDTPFPADLLRNINLPDDYRAIAFFDKFMYNDEGI